jgi:hypothetical protein
MYASTCICLPRSMQESGQSLLMPVANGQGLDPGHGLFGDKQPRRPRGLIGELHGRIS